MAEPAKRALRAWDPKRSAEVLVAPEELGGRFLKGELRLVEGETYPLLGPDGSVWDTPAAGVEDALRRGYEVARREDVIAVDAPDQNLQAFAEAALRGATFGLSDGFLASEGLVEADELQARRDANPAADALGVGAGSVAAALATGGFGPGALAMRGAARLAGGRTGAALGGAAAGAVEGGLYGAGSAVSEAVLGDSELVAQRVLAGAGAGAFWGAAAGGPLGALLGRARPRDADIEAVYAAATGNEPAKGLGRLVRKAQDASRAAHAKAAALGGADPEFVRKFYGPEGARALELALGPEGELDDLARSLRDRLAKHLASSESVARRPSEYALGALTPGGPRALGDLAAAREAVINHFRKGLEHVDGGRVNSFVRSITRPKSDPVLKALAEYRTQLAAAVPTMDDATRAATLEADHGLMMVLDDIEERVVARNQWQEQMRREAQAAAGALTGRLGLGFGGALFGGPLGAAAGLAVSEGVEAVARPAHTLMRRAAQMRALSAVSQYAKAGAARLVAGPGKVVDRLPESLRRALPRAVAPTTLAMLDGSKDSGELLERRREELQAVAFNPAATSFKLEGLDDGDPRTGLPDAANIIRVRLGELNEWLRQHAPTPLIQGRRGFVPYSDVYRFARLDAVAQDPLRLIDDLAEGRLPSPEEVEVVRRFYPSVLEDFQEGIREALAEDPDALDWEQTLRLGIALGLPTHDSLAPLNLGAQQARAQQPLNQPAAQPPKPPSGPGRGELATTQLDRIQEQ